jgi:predicted Fe-Mo cluster-binding NifX family protein
LATLCVPVTPDGEIGRWGRAQYVAIVEFDAAGIRAWGEHHVRWDEQHDAAAEGSHHARIAAFLRQHGVTIVLASHMGPPMEHMLEMMGITVRLGATGDARLAVAATLGSQRLS